jgi:acyl-[acyl-carrier-protein]-phospholipid O-acyltransferase/long-chain-fatty-acid--[acyl-carrier-protein] ligase
MSPSTKPLAASTRTPFDIRRTRRSLLSALIEARDRFGGDKVILVDADRGHMTYDELLQGAFALGCSLRKCAARGDTIGIMLPTGIPAALTFIAVHTFGRVPAMLNFTAGARNVAAACTASRIRTVVTSRRFVQLAKLQPLIGDIEAIAPTVYLEDLRDDLSWTDKTAGAIGPHLPSSMFRNWPSCDEPAVVLFTSGTEGDPKGVVLSHANVLANVEQVRAHLDIYPVSDILFNPLPTFHCFGLTVGLVLPLMVGVRTVFHPSPLQAKEITKRIRETRATILFATDTFISQYARASAEGDLASLRLAVCGAEHVRDETRQLVRRRCNMEILEGYGVTEAAAVVAANLPGDANRLGTVGKFMAGVEYRLEPVLGIANAGRLLLRGPNVMTGYVRPEAPGIVEPPPDGWHDTGDVVSIDADGYVTVLGRAKRFAKIAGEMVSLTVVENCASALWPDNAHAAVAIADERKGEQIVLLTDATAANRAELVGWVKSHGVPELAVPRHVVHVASVPLLGTGKPDYAAVAKLVTGRLSPTSSTAA